MPIKNVLLGFFGFALVLVNDAAFSQSKTPALLKKLQVAKSRPNFNSDTASTNLLNQLSFEYLYYNADSALYYAQQALSLSKLQNSVKSEIVAWHNIARSQYVIGNYDKSLDAATRLMSFSNKIGDNNGMAGAYMVTGLICLEQNKQTEALSDFNKALDLYTRLDAKVEIGTSYFNIAIAYDEMGKPEKAFGFLNKAIATANQARNSNLLSMAQNRTGEIYFHQKNYQKALGFYQKVATGKNTTNWERDFALSGMAQCFYGLGQYKKAIDAAQKSYRLSRQVNSDADAARALEILAESYAAIRDYGKAYQNHVQFKKLNDSLFNSDREKLLSNLQLKQQQADNKRLEEEVKSKEAELEFRSRLTFFRNLIALAVISFIVYIILSNRQKTVLNKVLKKQNDDISKQKEEISKQKEILDELNHTKNQLFSIISHDLRSPFAAMMQSIDLIRAGDFGPEEQNRLMEEFYRQVNQVNIMVNNLLAWAATQQDGVKCKPVKLDTASVVDDVLLVNGFVAKNKNIFIDHQSGDAKPIFADPDHFRIIIQNLVGNAIKFTRPEGIIHLFYTQDADYVAIHIQDSGIGMKPEKLAKLFKVSGKEISGYGTNNETGAGIGLAIIRQFIDANHGRIDVQSKNGEGSEFTVFLPKA